MCGFMGIIPQKEFNRINSGRTKDQYLSRMGFLNDGLVKCRETRDAMITIDTHQINYLEAKEDSLQEGWDESIQEHNRSTNSEGLHEWDYVCSDMDGSMLYDMETRESEKLNDSDQEVYEEVKGFEELNSEEIDEVAAKIRKISPKFEDLIRPEIMETQKWLEYEQDVEKIAIRRENVYAVMPLREKKQVIVPPRQEARTQRTESISAAMPPTEEKQGTMFSR